MQQLITIRGRTAQQRCYTPLTLLVLLLVLLVLLLLLLKCVDQSVTNYNCLTASNNKQRVAVALSTSTQCVQAHTRVHSIHSSTSTFKG
jgi:hypothetical protein